MPRMKLTGVGLVVEFIVVGSRHALRSVALREFDLAQNRIGIIPKNPGRSPRDNFETKSDLNCYAGDPFGSGEWLDQGRRMLQ